jgi:peptide/nickel transport system permease protein
LRYLIRRLLQFIPTLTFAAVLVFAMVDLAPGDAVDHLVGMREGATQAQMDEMRQELGLDRPFLVRLGNWYAQALRGDLGESITNKGTPVAELIAERWPVTFSMTAIALVVALVSGVSAGVLAALWQGRLADWMLMVLALFVVSMPHFWLGLIMIIVFGVKLRWLPIGGYVPLGENPIEFIRHLILPCTVLGLVYAGMIARMTRTCVLEVLNLDYVQTARAKGFSQRVVIVRHALRNALIPLSTVVGLSVGAMLGGAVITETVFNIRGLGRLIVDGILHRDFPVVQGGLLVVTVGYLVITLVVDLGYAWLDPRIRYE